MRTDVAAPWARKMTPWARRWIGAAALLALAGLAGCGGGGGGGDNDDGNARRVTNCDAGSRKAQLAEYFNEWYFWTTQSPKPAPNGTHTLAAYFDALLYAGGSAGPADRWSYYESVESFNRFFGDGRTLGFGVAVAGLEVQGRPDQPLYVRYVDPRSPAAAAGVVRGDRVLSLNGRPVAELIAAGDFSALTASDAGQTLRLELASASGGNRSVSLTSASYDLVPVPTQQVVSTASGRRVGYVMVKDMVSQAVSPATEAFASLRSAGVTELVLDLRYNGGGLVSVARDIASLVGGSRSAGRTYASLLYNAQRAPENNDRYSFNDPAQGLGLQRVYILAGERTCSASEQLANGLRPFVNVVLVGDTTCGKPVGFVPHDDRCGTVYNIVNFETVNANNEGRFFDGLQPTCAVAEDWSKPLGSIAEPLLATALRHADGGSCTAATVARTRQRALAAAGGPRIDEGERRSMIADR
jgi:carboxyl-terminal processing protease